MSSSSKRDHLNVPATARYRRKTTVGIINSVPNSARLSSTPRPASALDKKWIHNSQGDLVNDMDLHIHPRLQSDFYQDLYKKYLAPLRSNHKDSRDSGRKLFNSRHHVRFKDEYDGPVPRCVSSLELRSPGFISARNLTRDKNLTNWDREVGHYLKNHSHTGTRDCVTSAEPSECSGSVLSVTQRLRQNGQTLKRLLNEESPFRNRFRKENVQYKENIDDNDQSLEEYMLEKSLERSRHRKHQRRIIIQRKILKAEQDSMNAVANDINEENNVRTKRWMSKSASPTRRNKVEYSLPPPGVHKSRSNGHHVDVDTLIADSDLKIDTLLDNINGKSDKLESPPDSAIDMDTPYLTNSKGGNKLDEVSTELSNLYDQAAADLREKCVSDEMESSPGSSASVRAMRNGNLIYSDNEEDNLMVSNGISKAGVEFKGDIDLPIADTNHENEIDEISKIVEKYSSCDHLNMDTGPGLLQLYSAEMGYNTDLNENVEVPDANNDVEIVSESNGVTEQNNGVTEIINGVDNKHNVMDHISGDGVNSVVNDEDDNNDNDDNGDSGTKDDVNIDEHDINVDIIVESRQSSLPKDMKSARDSDVDSGLGYSSACTDALPPHGRSRPRERTSRPNSKHFNNSCVPLKSDVDVDILNEVNLVHLSHDLTCDLGENRTRILVNDGGDDTDDRQGVSNMAEEKRLAQKYLRMRSPSPFIVKNQPSSTNNRPRSAPYFAKSESDLRIVDIPLLDTKQSKKVSTSSEDVHKQSDNTTQNLNLHNPSNAILQPCHNDTNNIGSHFVSMPNLSGTDELGTSTMSSISNHQRNYSSASISSKESSISPMSDSETDTNTQIYVANYKGAILDSDNKHEGAHIDSYKNHSENTLNTVKGVMEAPADFETMVMTTHSDISKKKGMYKPAVTSPRIKEKKMKLSNILKHKKGSFSPSKEASSDTSQNEERSSVNRIYAKNRGVLNSYENWVKQSNQFVSQSSDRGSNPDPDFEQENEDIEPNHVNHLSKPRREHYMGRLTPYDVAKTNSLDTESVDNFINGEPSNTVTARPVVLGDGDSNHLHPPEYTGHTVRPVTPVKAQPPKKPARTKKKHKAPAVSDIDLTKYKIDQNGGETGTLSSDHNVPSYCNELNQSQNSSQSEYQSVSSDQEERKAYRKSLSLQTPQDNDIEVLDHQTSNLKASKEMTSSKSSLFDKIKFSKFKGTKKSMSMDQGIDSAGFSPNSGNKSKGGHSFFPKMKKAPSLKSITSLFSRKKKKKGQFRIDDHEGASTQGSTLSVYSGQSNTLPNRNKQWTSCQTLNTDEPIRNQNSKSQDLQQPIGKLMKMYPDGTQLIQITKPDNGPIGFFIAKGSAKYGNGIFISRYSATRPEHCFNGLLGIGDEILEVNSHVVRDLSQDAVYNLISNSPTVVLKIFPFIARDDV